MPRFDALLDVPIVSEESAAFIDLVPEEVSTNLVNTPWVQSAEGVASVHFDAIAGSSTQVPLRFDSDFSAAELRWLTGTTTNLSLVESPVARVLPMFPGDSLRFPVELSMGISSPPGGGSLVGSFSARLEFRTRLPQPVAALPCSVAIPIGALGVAGLAAFRG